MITIESPVKGYTGISAGVGFAIGKALVKELTPTQENYFKKKGYVINKEDEKISHQEVSAKVETTVQNVASNDNANRDLSLGDLGAID